MQIYIDHFEGLKDTFGFVAEVEGKIVGAVLVRIINDYGHTDNETPSLIISYKEYRGFGLEQEYKKCNISICIAQHKKYGFKIIDKKIALWGK